jgi:hypothetical protein
MPTKGDSETERTIRRRSPSECKPLIEAANRELFRNNAFRITGLAVDTTTREISRRADKLKLMAELGDGESVHTAAYALKPPPTLDHIREAIQKLKDPERRIIDEFFWFWPEQFGESQTDAAILALAKGDSKKALEIWSAKEDDSVDGVIALHNLALAYHLTALDWENFAVENEVESDQQQKIAGYWRGAFKRWERLAVDDRLWEKVNARIRQIDDARLTTGFARRMRASLPDALDKINAELALTYAENGKLELARLHVQFMRESNQGLDDVDKTADMVLAPAKTRLREQIQRAQRRTESNPADGANAAYELLEHAKHSLALFDLFFGKDSDTRIELFDEVASVCNQLPVAYQKATGDDKTCLELLRAVLPFATSIELRQQIEKNISTLDGNVAFKTLEPVFTLLKSIQESHETPRLRLDKFRREAVPALASAVSHLSPGSESYSELFNSAAIVLRGISLDAWNKHEDKNTAVAANDLAVKHACGVELKRQLREDKASLSQIATRQAAQDGSSNKGGLGCLVVLGIISLD